MILIGSLCAASTLTHGPIIGGLSSNSAKIWMRTDAAAKMKVLYKTATEESWHESGVTTTAENNDFTGTVELSSLTPDTTYNFKTVVGGTPSTEIYSFTTFTQLDKSFRFVVGADIQQSRAPHLSLGRLVAQHPLFGLLIGDQIYADNPAEITALPAFREKYRKQWAEPNLAAYFKAVPTFFIWDDHEITDNFSEGMHIPIAQNARKSYVEYQGQENPDSRTPHELYYSFSQANCDFYVMDLRSFRSKNTAIDDASKTMLGADQKADLKAWLSSSKAKFKFIISSVLFSNFGVTGIDSWSGFKTERDEIWNFIRDNDIRHVFIISGDQHENVVERLENGSSILYEVMATPLNANLVSTLPKPNPQILYRSGGAPIGNTYSVYDVDTTASPATLTVKIYKAEDDSVLYTLKVTEKDF